MRVSILLSSGCQLPPTRAKSPKLGRRKSCSDTVAKVKGISGRANRHSFVSYKEETTIAGDTNTKDNSNFHNVNNGNVVRNFNNETQQLAEKNKAESRHKIEKKKSRNSVPN